MCDHVVKEKVIGMRDGSAYENTVKAPSRHLAELQG